MVRVVPAGAYVWKGGSEGVSYPVFSLSTSQEPFKAPLNELSSASGAHSLARSGSTLGVVWLPFAPGCGLKGYCWWLGLLRVHSLVSTSWPSERLLCSRGWLLSLSPPTHIPSVPQWIQRTIDCLLIDNPHHGTTVARDSPPVQSPGTGIAHCVHLLSQGGGRPGCLQRWRGEAQSCGPGVKPESSPNICPTSTPLFGSPARYRLRLLTWLCSC